MDKNINVLVFSGESEPSRELYHSLCAVKNVHVWAASSVQRSGRFSFKNYITGLPMITDPEFIQAFNDVLSDKSIDVVFPDHDSIVLFFAEHLEEFNAKIVVPDLRTAQICRDKKLTYELFNGEQFCPRVFSANYSYPCFAKPRDGQGGKGSILLRSDEDLSVLSDKSGYVITEYLEGSELTVDCITDSEGALRAVLPRTRDRMLAGICSSGHDVVCTEEIMSMASRINDKLDFVGLWYFQVKQDDAGVFKLLEVSGRCAGTMCMARAQGVNLPLLSLYAKLGMPFSVEKNPFHVSIDRMLISRYEIDYKYQRVYMDYDDTLIIEDNVYLPAIRFVYQCKNAGIPVVLISRHSLNYDNSLLDDLDRRCISRGLFEEIHDLSEGRSKTDFITRVGSIFIDNSFQEREAVRAKLGIPVFDVEGIEVLLDWRE